ncbi:tRNA uridine-5-carboxymethylaminomethyl(34) synthesis enzyme MnmG, partial [Mesorhizobium sp. M7A.F.Ca.CA.001.08.2.1]
AERLETEAKYSVYLDRQKTDVAQIRHEESRLIPETVDFAGVPGLSNELKQKMQARRPRSIADAQRMEGMTPAALAIIVAHVRHAESAQRLQKDVA